MAVGTSLDIDVVRKLSAAGGRPLQAYWKDLKLTSGNGYQIKPKQLQRDASHIRDLPDLNSTELFRFVVNPELLQGFDHPTACPFPFAGAVNRLLPLFKYSHNKRIHTPGENGTSLSTWRTWQVQLLKLLSPPRT